MLSEDLAVHPESNGASHLLAIVEGELADLNINWEEVAILLAH
jgi:hypothetical protein